MRKFIILILGLLAANPQAFAQTSGGGQINANNCPVNEFAEAILSNGQLVCAVPAGGGGSGTVTSISFADGSTSPIFTISGSPVTVSGTITETLSSQTQNKVLASPNGSSGQPTFRALVAADLPNGGAVAATTNTITTNFSFSTLVKNYILNVDTSAGAITVTMPDAVASVGFCAKIKNIGSPVSAINIGTISAQTIDSLSSLSLPKAMQSAELCAVNGAWWIN